VGVPELLQFVVSGLKNGAIYALIALGFSLVYSATGVINFAQGEFYMLGGCLCWLRYLPR
jgi:branched-chain amino acid transport system permease protein